MLSNRGTFNTLIDHKERTMKIKLFKWLKSGEYLPSPMRDLHDQKDLFKSMHHLYQGNEGSEHVPSWVSGHIYVIDFFLWFMASRGYTLQKTRKKGIEFKDWPSYRQILSDENPSPCRLVDTKKGTPPK